MADSEAGGRNRRVRFERPVPDDSLDGAGSGTWVLVKELWAEVRDLPPSRTDKLVDGISIASRPARVRILFRRDLSSEMRVVLLRKVGSAYVAERVMQIVGGPAELGTRERLEFLVEDYRPVRNQA